MFLIVKNHIIEIGQNFKSFFQLALRGQFSDAFKVIGYSRQEIFYWIGFGFALSAIVNLILREDLKPQKKIIPILGYSIVALFSLFAGLILFGAAATLIPFLVIIGTTVSFADNVSRYFAEKAEREVLISKMQNKSIEKIVQVVKEPLASKIKDFLQEDHFDRDDINTVFYRIGTRFLNETDKAQEELLDETLQPQRRKELKHGLKALFKEKYGPLLDFIALKQSLHFLHKSVRRLYSNSWLFGTVVALNIFTAMLPILSFNMIVLATSPWVYGALGFFSVSLWLIATLDSTRLMLQKTISDKKIAMPRKVLEQGILPKIEKPEQGKGLQRLYQPSTWLGFLSFFSRAWDGVWSFLSKNLEKSCQLAIGNQSLGHHPFSQTKIEGREFRLGPRAWLSTPARRGELW